MSTPPQRRQYFTLPVYLLLVCQFVLSSETTAAERPNIVLIMADDMGYECVTANGGQSYITPNIDALAEEGMRFEHCYSQPICTPSRVQIMTGIYNSRNYVEFGKLPQQSFTFGNLLRDAGYATCVVGKWQLKGGFAGPARFGFDEYCLWQLTRRSNRYPNPGLEINGEERDFKDGQYGPDIVSDYACDFIERQSASKKPFFLYYPMILPHWPFEPIPDSDDWDPTFRRDDDQEKSRKTPWKAEHFADMVSYADKIVGKIVAKLEKHGLRENTLILFTGDNGTYETITSRFKNRDWRGGKGHMMDNGTHVTLVANQQGTIQAGQVNRDLVDFSDFFPTLAQWTGTSVPGNLLIDGQSFAPQLRGEPADPRPYVYCWYFRNGKFVAGGERHTAGESARNHRYKLYRTGDFYDVTSDFYETDPLDEAALDPDQQRIRAELSQAIERHTRPNFSKNN